MGDKYHAKVAVGSDVEQAIGIASCLCVGVGERVSCLFVCVCMFAPLSLPGPVCVAGSSNVFFGRLQK